jgi:hypothetical protein
MESKPISPPEDQSVEATPQASPVMDVVPPPAKADKEDSQLPVDQQEHIKQAESHETRPKPPKTPSSSVALAIVATLIIVLGLAVLATYAYLQTTK